MDNRFEEIKLEWQAMQGLSYYDAGWLIGEIERLCEARIKDHEYYIDACDHVSKKPDLTSQRSCELIAWTILQYCRGLKRAYRGESHNFAVVDSGDRRP